MIWLICLNHKTKVPLIKAGLLRLSDALFFSCIYGRDIRLGLRLDVCCCYLIAFNFGAEFVVAIAQINDFIKQLLCFFDVSGAVKAASFGDCVNAVELFFGDLFHFTVDVWENVFEESD